MLHAFGRNFLRGLLFVVPTAATVYVIWLVVRTLDRWSRIGFLLPWRVPGTGLLLTLLLITLVGFLAGNFMTRWMFLILDEALGRVPLVKLVYGSIRDLIDAFVGEKKRFDKPVAVSLADGTGFSVLGFLTREDLTELGLDDQVAVYVPQSYNFAGNLLIVPRERVRPIAVEPTVVMSLIVSGGVAGEHGPGGTADVTAAARGAK